MYFMQINFFEKWFIINLPNLLSNLDEYILIRKTDLYPKWHKLKT